MQTVIIVLDPGKLNNPDADLRYQIPDRIEEYTNQAICENGYDYIELCDDAGPLMAIWLKTENADEGWKIVWQLFEKETFMENDLSKSAQIYISENADEELENCTLIYPTKDSD